MNEASGEFNWQRETAGRAGGHRITSLGFSGGSEGSNVRPNLING